jgi:ribonuclease P protein component
LRRSDFRRIYDKGFRVAGPCFAAFCLKRPDDSGPRIGFTTPRALGSAVSRNRAKRRAREAVRQQLYRLAPNWDIVFNPRRSILDAPFEEIKLEVEKVFSRCKG